MPASGVDQRSRSALSLRRTPTRCRTRTAAPAVDRRLTGMTSSGTGSCLREVAGERPPDDGDVDVSAPATARRCAPGACDRVVAVDGVAGDVVDDAAAAQRVRRRRVGAVVADHLHADLQLAQHRIVEANVTPVGRRPLRDHEDVAASGSSGRSSAPARTRPGTPITTSQGFVLERVADEAAALRPPDVARRCA